MFHRHTSVGPPNAGKARIHSGDDSDRWASSLELQQVLNQSSHFDHLLVSGVHERLKVRKLLLANEMPPEKKKKRPNANQRTLLADWTRHTLDTIYRTAPPDPGRVTVRRLNRAEYTNTIRDLMRVDFEPAKDFPADDAGYGFDNIGDVLTMSPL